MQISSLLKGAYDLHVHSSPDVVPRAQDIIEVAKSARGAGIKGILLKDHTTSTVGRCYALNAITEGSIRFVSSLALNPPVGGLNPTAVESALRSGVDVIYFPTYGAAHHISIWGAGKPPTAFPLGDKDRIGIGLFAGDGGLQPLCHEILAMIAADNCILATGHISPDESLLLLRTARGHGVKRMVVTHASESVTNMNIEKQKEAAGLGAFIEHCFFAATPACPNPISLDEMAEQIKAIGVEHVILSSDLGQKANGPVVEGFAHYLKELLRRGFSRDEIRVMIADNPEKLLALRKK